MSWNKQIAEKIFTSRDALSLQCKSWQAEGKKIVFTNGCFDILHLGHLDYLSKAADLGDKLIIGVNTDASVQRLKGENRPVIDEYTRATKLAFFAFVDAVILFDEETPLELIKTTSPNILVKGGDYTIDTVVGAKEVIASGGEVRLLDFLAGHSTSKIIEKIRK